MLRKLARLLRCRVNTENLGLFSLVNIVITLVTDLLNPIGHYVLAFLVGAALVLAGFLFWGSRLLRRVAELDIVRPVHKPAWRVAGDGILFSGIATIFL